MSRRSRPTGSSAPASIRSTASVVVKTEPWSKHPQARESLLDAFVAAKKPTWKLKRTKATAPTTRSIAVPDAHVGDPLPYGIKANRPSIEAMLTYGLQQELIPRAAARQVFVDPILNHAATGKQEYACLDRRHPSARHLARHQALSAQPARRHAVHLVERAADHLSRRWSRPWTRPASTRRRSCRPRPPMATTTPMWRMRSPPYPKRFTGVYSVDVLAPDAVRRCDHWIGAGCTGMRLFTTGSTMPGQATWFVDPRTYPAWEHAARPAFRSACR